MKIIFITLFVFLFGYDEKPPARVVRIIHEYADSTRIMSFHSNGNMKSEGTKINKFKHGKWKYYDVKGFLLTIETYSNGKNIHTYNLKEY